MVLGFCAARLTGFGFLGFVALAWAVFGRRCWSDLLAGFGGMTGILAGGDGSAAVETGTFGAEVPERSTAGAANSLRRRSASVRCPQPSATQALR